MEYLATRKDLIDLINSLSGEYYLNSFCVTDTYPNIEKRLVKLFSENPEKTILEIKRNNFKKVMTILEICAYSLPEMINLNYYWKYITRTSIQDIESMWYVTKVTKKVAETLNVENLINLLKYENENHQGRYLSLYLDDNWIHLHLQPIKTFKLINKTILRVEFYPDPEKVIRKINRTELLEDQMHKVELLFKVTERILTNGEFEVNSPEDPHSE